jgi:DNA repair ATPase RecN
MNAADRQRIYVDGLKAKIHLLEKSVAAQKTVLHDKDAEIARLTKERDEYRTKMLSEGGKFLKEMQRADLLKDEVAALSADLARLKPSGPVAEDVQWVALALTNPEASSETFVRAQEAHSRIATQAQSAQAKDETIKALVEALRNLRCVAVSQGVSEQHGVIINADTALAGVLK